MRKHILALFFLFVAIVVLVTMSSCSKKNTSNDYITLWFDNSREYRTNNLEIAQNETPFSIVLPTYIPEDIINYPFFEGRSKSVFQDNIPVRIMYYQSGRDFIFIYIREYNQIYTIHPSNKSNLLTFSKVEVIEQDMKMVSFGEDSRKIPGFAYLWNFNDIHFQVEIYDYPRDIARKIIQSMIR